MKLALCLTVCALAFPGALLAQEKQRKSMTFQPGAKTPEATPAAAKAAPKASPAPRPPATPAPAATANATSANDQPAEMAVAFFSLLSKSLVEEAYTNLTRGSKIAERPQELQTLKARTNEAIQIFGTIHGHELIESKQVGAHLLRRTYLSLGHDFPLRWRFYFYRAQDQWRLVDLRVDDRLTGMFEEPEEAAPPAPAPPQNP